jgi:hypothetical protein
MVLPLATVEYKVPKGGATAANLAAALSQVPVPASYLASIGCYVETDTGGVVGPPGATRTLVVNTVAPTPATATASLVPGQSASGLAGVTITAHGIGYVAPPVPIVLDVAQTVPDWLHNLPAGAGAGAKLLAYLGLYAAPAIVSGGAAYAASSTIAFVGGMPPGLLRNGGEGEPTVTTRTKDAPSNTALHLEGCVSGATVTSGGANYSASTTVTVLGEVDQAHGGILAKAIPVIAGGVIVGITIIDPGAGYIVAPTLVIQDPTGAGSGAKAVVLMQHGRPARATLTILGGVITGVVVTDPGDGYIAPPSAVVFDPTGAGSGAVISPGPVSSGGGTPSAMGVSRIDILNAGEGYSPGTTIDVIPLFTFLTLVAQEAGDVAYPLRYFQNLMKTPIQNLLSTAVAESVS